jgi:hypothetical protein
VRAFWDGWLAWSHERGIDYFIGRTLAPQLASLGLTKISGTAETAIYNGGSLWADYWIETITELRSDLISSSKLDEAVIDKFLAYCFDSNWWTQTIAFTAVHSRMPGVQAAPSVVILRQSSNFGGATVSGVYTNRDCAQYFYIAPDPFTGGAQFERGDR